MSKAISLKQAREEFTASRKGQIGGSDIASVMAVGRYGCARKLFYDKKDFPKDENDSEKMEFRRGHRLEGAASSYYEELTGREVRYTTTSRVPGKKHLAVNIDRLIKDEKREDWGALEIKVVGRGSWISIKKNGLIDDYCLQIQYNMAVGGYLWGAFAIYCPDIDELIFWDVEFDPELGAILLERADDFFCLNIDCNIEPDQLPEDSPPCQTCPWSISCRGKSMAETAAAGIISRPDLEGLAAKYREVSGMQKEAEQAKETIREEILEAIKEKPGSYQFGKHSATFTSVVGKRFDGKLMQKENYSLYESYRKETITNTLRIKE